MRFGNEHHVAAARVIDAVLDEVFARQHLGNTGPFVEQPCDAFDRLGVRILNENVRRLMIRERLTSVKCTIDEKGERIGLTLAPLGEFSAGLVGTEEGGA